MDLITQPQFQFESVDASNQTEIAIVNPAVALLSIDPDLLILIASQSLIMPDAVRLHGVRQITLPRGIGRRWLEFKSRLFTACLPDEIDFDEVRLELSHGNWIARAVHGGTLCRGLRKSFPLSPLAAIEYQRMLVMRGRFMEKFIEYTFRDAITNWDQIIPEQPAPRRRAA